MSPLIRFISWTVAIGNGGAVANAGRAVQERAQADAALDARFAGMSRVASNGVPSSGAAPSRAA
jgi:hypothetical protein